MEQQEIDRSSLLCVSQIYLYYCWISFKNDIILRLLFYI